jgi:hypothetical protein
MGEPAAGAGRTPVPRWNEITSEDDAGREVAGIVEWLRKNDSGRLARCQDDLSYYEGCKLPGLSPAAYLRSAPYGTDDYKTLRWNIPRSLCHTVQAKLAGKNRPKVQFVTSSASWKQKRRAYHLDRFAEAQFHLRQGQHGNIWELAALLLLHSVVIGDGFAYVYADDTEQQVAVDPLFPWQMFVDANDAAQGRPQCLFIVRPFDRDLLAGKYVGKPELVAAIQNAKACGMGDGVGSSDGYYSTGVRSAEQVEVIDAFCLPTGKGKDGKPTGGRHIRYIDGKTLESVPWTRREFPIVRLKWAAPIQGWFSQSLVSEVRTVSDEINSIVQRLSDCVKRTQKAVWFYPEGSIKPEDLNNNEDGINIGYDPAYPKPDCESPAPFDSATLDWLRMNIEQCFQLPGVSQMAATARKEQGVTAAIALRTLDDQQTERLGTQQNGYELFFVDLCRHMIACTRELAQTNPDYKVTWPGEGFLKEIKWRDVDLPEDQYIMRPHPVSNLKNTPTDRLQLAQDMYGSGVFGKAALEESIKYLNAPDQLSGGDKQGKLVDRYIESWLDATEESLADGTFKFRSPFPYLNLPAAMLQVAEAYVEAQLDEAPDFNLDFFLRFLQQCDEIVAERAAQQAPPPPSPGLPSDGMAPPAPAAPPMAPMMAA